jgi:hypothetical protein
VVGWPRARNAAGVLRDVTCGWNHCDLSIGRGLGSNYALMTDKSSLYHSL